MKPIGLRIAEELGVREQQVAAAISLLDGGATVPFVARYGKEATGALDDAQLRTIEERLRYLRELDERRAAILDSIGQQRKLDCRSSDQFLPLHTGPRVCRLTAGGRRIRTLGPGVSGEPLSEQRPTIIIAVSIDRIVLKTPED